MPDIAMCPGDDCPSKLKCFRYMAEPDQYRQSYMMFTPDIDSDRCGYFWPIEKAITKLRTDADKGKD